MTTQSKRKIEDSPGDEPMEGAQENFGEIDKIMSEIEDLKKEMDAAAPITVPTIAKSDPVLKAQSTQSTDLTPSEVSESSEVSEEMIENVALTMDDDDVELAKAAMLEQITGEEPWLEETMAQLKNFPGERGSPLDSADDVRDSLETNQETIGTLSMSVEGNLNLKLNYGNNGQFLRLSFDELALRIQFSDGTEFKVPIPRDRLRAA